MSDILGALFGSTTQNTPQVYKPQAPYLKFGLGQAKDNYQNAAAKPYYQGETYAGLAPGVGDDVLANARRFMSGLGTSVPGQLGQAGSDALAGGAGFAGNANHILSGMFDNPNGALDMGNSFANSQQADGLVDAANRDVTRSLRQDQLPGINRSAIGGGNLNSSRAGVLTSHAVRDAGDREADNSAAIRGGLFNQGVGQFNTNTQNELGANSQLLDSLGFGANASTAALNAGQAGNAALQNASSFEQANRQGQDTANFNQWQGQDQRLMQLLQQYWGIAGGQIGQNTGSTTTPGIITQLASAAGAAAKVAGM